MAGDMPRVRLHTHASISVLHDDVDLLCDPWFFGRVFNNSWQLLVPPDETNVDYERLHYIWISHEHPDHFHIPTLKQIAGSARRRITVLFQRQKNKNVVEALQKLGFAVQELDIGVPRRLDNGLAVTCYRYQSDSALVMETGGCTILNQNDCRLQMRTCRKILRRHGPIDLWLFQFSLAGYYANHDDHAALERARAAHLRLIRSFDGVFGARLFVPFASFIAFCREGNRFLNRWQVRPTDVLALDNMRAQTQLLCNEDLVLWDVEAAKRRNAQNSDKWTRIFDQGVQPDPDPSADPVELLDVGRRFAETICNRWPTLALPPSLRLRLTDLGQDAVVDLRAGRFELTEAGDLAHVAADLDSASLLFLMKFPWGADTVHISSCFYVRDALVWKWLTYVRHLEYKFPDGPTVYRFAPRLLAFARVRLGISWHDE